MQTSVSPTIVQMVFGQSYVVPDDMRADVTCDRGGVLTLSLSKTPNGQTTVDSIGAGDGKSYLGAAVQSIIANPPTFAGQALTGVFLLAIVPPECPPTFGTASGGAIQLTPATAASSIARAPRAGLVDVLFQGSAAGGASTINGNPTAPEVTVAANGWCLLTGIPVNQNQQLSFGDAGGAAQQIGSAVMK